MTCLLTTKASITDCSTNTDTSLLSANCKTVFEPAAKATVPSRASNTPSLRTSGASKAM